MDGRLARAIVSLGHGTLRRDYAVDLFLRADAAALAPALDELALRAEQGDAMAKEALVAVVDALNDVRLSELVQRLREEIAGAGLVTLDRLLRRPARSGAPISPRSQRPPDYGYGRPLTLGERKSLARRPDRGLLERLLADPHPDVIRGVLSNPRLTEDDVVRFVARTPSHPDLLAEVARTPRWAHRPRVRLALILNPFSPIDLALPLASLLLRHELRLVVESTTVLPALRATCLEHLRRKYPHDDDERPLQ
ncbi:MAG TPA: hypothetical protein VLM85_05215 [Polyangiaceae bacterium]|nr:hypothetical protein [Polyangiaceae bacterium]